MRPMILGLVLLSTACKPDPTPDDTDTDTDDTDTDTDDTDTDPPIDALDRKIGQLLVVGFRGTEIEEGMPIVQQVRDGLVGGVVLFDYDVERGRYDRNVQSPDQVRTLIADLKALTDDTLLVTIDQEGGLVARLKERWGFPATTSAQDLGEADDTDTTYDAGAAIGATLLDMGIQLNLAPVVDVNVNPDSPAIGAVERSFSADPAKVVAHAGAFLDGMASHGIQGTLKHFPGHGSATADSHEGVTDISATWSDHELIPYQDLLAAGKSRVVMTAHVFHEDLDPTWPATLSTEILQGILRDDLGFDGVVISDDLQMGAIQDSYGLETVVERALLAGNDLLAFANNNPDTYEDDIAPQVIAIVRRLIGEGRVPMSRIDEAHARVTALKASLSAGSAARR